MFVVAFATASVLIARPVAAALSRGVGVYLVYPMFMTGPRAYLSARVSPRTLQRLDGRAQRQRRPRSALVEQYLVIALDDFLRAHSAADALRDQLIWLP